MFVVGFRTSMFVPALTNVRIATITRTTETATFKAIDLAGASGSDDLTLTVGNAPHAIISYNKLDIREEEEFDSINKVYKPKFKTY